MYDVRHAQQLESIYRNTITIVIMWSVSRKCQQRRSAVIQYIIQIDALCAREKIKTYNTCDPGTCVYSKWRRISFRYAFRWKTLPHFLYRSIACKNIINNLFSDFLFWQQQVFLFWDANSSRGSCRPVGRFVCYPFNREVGYATSIWHQLVSIFFLEISAACATSPTIFD